MVYFGWVLNSRLGLEILGSVAERRLSGNPEGVGSNPTQGNNYYQKITKISKHILRSYPIQTLLGLRHTRLRWLPRPTSLNSGAHRNILQRLYFLGHHLWIIEWFEEWSKNAASVMKTQTVQA